MFTCNPVPRPGVSSRDMTESRHKTGWPLLPTRNPAPGVRRAHRRRARKSACSVGNRYHIAADTDLLGDDRQVRSKQQRRFISLFAIVALAATAAADLCGLHSCPHHDALAAVTTADVGPIDSHAPAASHHGHAQDAPDEPAGDDHHGPCNCLGACSANTPAAPLDHQHVSIVATLSSTSVNAPAGTLPHARTTPYLLPWANAPPLSASI